MKAPNITIVIAAMLGLIGVGNTLANDNFILNVYRDSKGHLTPASKDAEKEMKRIAKDAGEITLFLTLNFAYDLYLAETSDEVAIDAQDQAVRDGFAEVLDSLVADGSVWYPNAEGAVFSGPGCAVLANDAGLKNLIKDERIMHIVGVE